MPMSPEGRARLVESKKAQWAAGVFDKTDFGEGRAPVGADPVMWKAFCAHRKNARSRGIEFLLTFNEWQTIWLHSGKWAFRGRGRDRFVMARLGPDVGPYAVGNVHIQRGADNVADGSRGIKRTPEQNAARSLWMRGNKNGARKRSPDVADPVIAPR